MIDEIKRKFYLAGIDLTDQQARIILDFILEINRINRTSGAETINALIHLSSHQKGDQP